MSDVEHERLRALRNLGVLDTLPEEGFDRLTALAAALFDAPIALVSLIDQDRQWFKSRHGLDATETPRAWAFCNHAIAYGPNSTFIVEDATADERFADNPLVTGDPHVRFYVGATLTNGAGQNLGTLCVIDNTARSSPSQGDVDRLKVLARMVVDELELGRAKRAITEQKRLLELAELMSGVGHWRYDVKNGEIFWSGEVYKIHGLDPSSFDPNYDEVVACYHPDDRATVTGYVERAITFGEDYAFQLRLLRSDGELRNVVCKAACEFDAHGATAAVFGVFQDVTDQVRTFTAIAQSEARYRRLADNGSDIVVEASLDGRFTYISPAVRSITGFDEQELLGRQSMDLVHPDDRSRVEQEIRAALKCPGGARIEHRHITKDGRVIWVETRPALARDRETGAAMGVTDVIRDITDRKRAEVSLAESEQRYRLIADNASDMISQCNFNGEITFLTPACRQILGYEPEALMGTRTLDMMHPDDRSGVATYYADLIAKGVDAVSEPFQFRARHKDDRWIWLEGQPKIFFDADTGKPVAMQDVVRDVTTRKELESALRHARTEAESATVVKSEFLANMSHELRTPLTSILGFSKLLGEQAALDDDGRRYLQRVSDASQALLATVNDILDFSKLEAGQVKIDPRPVNPTALVTSAVELLGLQAAAKGLTLIVECDELPAQIVADDTRIRQILLNLISNAVKFTSTGGVTVKARYDRAAERLRCDVVDTGPGVSPDKLDRLFKRFSQVDASTTRSHGGTGLGLAICKGLAEAMGGEVGASSVMGQGSRFWFEAPCAPLTAPSFVNSTMAALCASSDLQGLRVMIVDDNLVNRELVRIILTPFGVALGEADGGRAAIELAQTEPFDVILMDVRMPDIDGPSAARSIRDGGGPNADTPIIAFTAEANGRELPPLWRGLFDDQLPKPIIAADLLNVVDAWKIAPSLIDHPDAFARKAGS